MGLLFNTADHYHCLAEIGLSMAWRARQRNEHFAMPPTVLPHIVLDDGIAALEAMLVAKPLENPLGRMPLLAWSLPVF
ncbi:hypothetical protein METH_23035 (plasmid) [Leisingera methylohalidivorans DSM 14336]|uniref:Uncharacterized protein n=1 Tax=Leisingera methylohalidivorans DSM 14336 TaxID=999552 RepID=V9W143_9RHOB|nr:hypothetical protein METH_23035 [Leisingera methylohalidivorans DSM 14336]